MAELVTLAQAKAQIRVEHSDEDQDIADKVEQATDIVIGYLKRPEHSWTVETVPPRVRAAILLVFEGLYDRKDELITPTVVSLLQRDRDPALA